MPQPDALPSIIMMIFTSIYGIVDGLFVSNYVGKTAFAAVNLVMPLMMGVSALGFMVGTGGSAIVAKTLGEGEHKKANEYFSLLVYVTFIGGVIFSLCGMLLVRPVASLLGAEGALLDNCVLYGRICFISMPAFMLQNVFQRRSRISSRFRWMRCMQRHGKMRTRCIKFRSREMEIEWKSLAIQRLQ